VAYQTLCTRCYHQALEDDDVLLTLEAEAEWTCYRITYSTNWMGVVNLQWYRDRGLLHKVSRVMESDSRFNDAWRAGDVVEFEEVTESYSCGRIDVRGTDNHYGDEIGVPPMRSEDWNQFGFWLDTFETDRMWTLAELTAEYEKTNPPIRWDSKEQQP
jgi:hypothetical protein